MTRLVVLIGSLGCLSSLGCASTWDTVTGRDFRNAPFKKTFSSEDPMTVLRTKSSGTERAEAMRRLKEPSRNGGSPAEQDEALQMLTQAALQETSPIVRIAAIDALGRFEDPKAVRVLIAAYNQADTQAKAAATDILQTGYTAASGGFTPEFANTIRVRTIAALADTRSPEAVTLLSQLALTKPATENEPNDLRVAAVRGLKKIRHPSSVKALHQVLNAEYSRDVVLTNHAHEGLMDLTGKKLPADPQKWSEVVQSGADVVPEANGLQRAINWR